MKEKIVNFIRYNRLFCTYVILSIICCVLLRWFTIGDIGNIKPLIFEFIMPIFVGSFAYLIKPEKQFTYYLVMLILLNIVCVVNAIYYEWYSSFASFSLLASLGQVSEVDDAIVSKMKIIDFVYLLSIVIYLFINWYFKKINYYKDAIIKGKTEKHFKNLMIFSLVFIALGACTLSATSYSRLARQWNREYVVSRFGIIIYQTNDFINTLKPSLSSVFGYDVAMNNFNEYFSNNKRNVSNNEYTNLYKDYNVIFVHMESLTDFLIDLKINDTTITPNLNKLVKNGMYFSNYYPQISVGTSSDTEFTVLTSLLPSSNGTVFNNYYNRDYITTAKLLRDKGYYTFSMHGNKASMWNRNIVHPVLGYTDFYSSTSYDIDEVIGLGLSDKSFFKQTMPILESIEGNNEHYMGTIITLSNHTPFNNNEIFEQIDLSYHLDSKESFSYLEDKKLGDYIRSSHYADEALGEFIDYINNSDYFNNTLFVFYGDHDPKLDISEFEYYYNFNPKNGEMYDFSDEDYIPYDYFSNELNRKTPLIIWTKNNSVSKVVDYYMGAIDVMPTVGNMLGIYNEYALGNDIFTIKDNNLIVFPNGNFLSNKVYYRSSTESYKILDLDTELKEGYIDDCKEKADEIIGLSNDIIVYDLINKSRLVGEK